MQKFENTKGLKSTSKTKDEKNFLILGFFKSLVTHNHNLPFNKDFYLSQAVNCSLRLLENGYEQICVFVKDFQFKISSLKFFIIDLVAFQTVAAVLKKLTFTS